MVTYLIILPFVFSTYTLQTSSIARLPIYVILFTSFAPANVCLVSNSNPVTQNFLHPGLLSSEITVEGGIKDSTEHPAVPLQFTVKSVHLSFALSCNKEVFWWESV